MKRRSELGKLQARCDKEMQLLGKILYPKSLLSGLPTQVMHHFFPKSVCARLRYDWENLIPLTNGEHMRLHQSGDPTYEMRIREIKGDKWYSSLLLKKREMIKVNKQYYEEVLEKLQNRKDRKL